MHRCAAVSHTVVTIGGGVCKESRGIMCMPVCDVAGCWRRFGSWRTLFGRRVKMGRRFRASDNKVGVELCEAIREKKL